MQGIPQLPQVEWLSDDFETLRISSVDDPSIFSPLSLLARGCFTADGYGKEHFKTLNLILTMTLFWRTLCQALS